MHQNCKQNKNNIQNYEMGPFLHLFQKKIVIFFIDLLMTHSHQHFTKKCIKLDEK